MSILFILAGTACTVFDDRHVPARPLAPPPDTKVEFLQAKDAARVCALMAECPRVADSLALSNGVHADAENFSLCMEWLAAPIPADRAGFSRQHDVLTCLASCGSCDDARGCLAYELLADDDARCAPASTMTTCIDDQTALRCDKGQIWHCDVAAFGDGATCRIGANGVATCGYDGCNATPACTSDGVLTYCGDGMLNVKHDCAAEGLVCGHDSNGNVACAANDSDPPDPCDPGVPLCNGDVAEVCTTDGYSHFDCKLLGRTCDSSLGVARCVSKSGEGCTPNDRDVNVCSGDKLTACVAGQREVIDCAASSLKCVAGDGKSSGRCAAPPGTTSADGG